MQYAYPLLAIFIWAGNTVINKLAVGAIFPAEIGFYRWLLAGLLFTPFMLRPVLSHWPVIRPNLWRIAILGILGMAVYQSLAYFAASLTSATNMGIILSLMPLMSLAMAIAALGQRLTAGALVGAVLSFAGVLLVVSSGSLAALLQHGVNLGDAMMLVATLAYAIYSTLLKNGSCACHRWCCCTCRCWWRWWYCCRCSWPRPKSGRPCRTFPWCFTPACWPRCSRPWPGCRRWCAWGRAAPRCSSTSCH